MTWGHCSVLTFALCPPRFRMKCHLCVNYIEMQTDPANCDYVIVSGAQRKEERWDMADNEQVLTTGERRGRAPWPARSLSRSLKGLLPSGRCRAREEAEAGDGRHVPPGARRGRPEHTQESPPHPEPHPGGPERLEG